MWSCKRSAIKSPFKPPISPRIANWRTQIRKGYLELCLLALISKHGRLYGFDVLSLLKQQDLEVKEGTLYPLLNRMTADGLLKAIWEIENSKGHPRKYYSLSELGRKTFTSMDCEFSRLFDVFSELKNIEKTPTKTANKAPQTRSLKVIHKQDSTTMVKLTKVIK
ncbi:PadR family transcriptional regulator [Candidatus Kaiserbacteria bacterium]|nr:MAG: PadR family transcriptional regulator [Candidatus Kaiserbacteria bacterium]